MTEQKIDNTVAIALLVQDVETLKVQIAELTKTTQQLVDAWNAANNVVRFVKWLSSLVTALGIIYLFIKHGLGIGGKAS